jgi:hypothetical protein
MNAEYLTHLTLLQEVLPFSYFLRNKNISLITSMSFSVSGVVEWLFIYVKRDSCIVSDGNSFANVAMKSV